MTSAAPVLRIYRTPIVSSGAKGAARRLLIEGPNLFLCAIENGADPDKLPSGAYDLVMTRMASSGTAALWLPGTELFIHPANWPSQLKGCCAPGEAFNPDGVSASNAAMADIFVTLGGFKEGQRVPVQVIELQVPL